MLRKYSNSRTHTENLKLGVLSAFSAGMVNVASLLAFFSFTSNVTGHYAILAAELAGGNLQQVAVVVAWILLFFMGSFTSGFIVINFNKKNTYLAHAMPIILEIICLFTVGFYGYYYYQETLIETELMLSLMLFAMGLQNGLTASISNFAIKTTHLTGITTDLGIIAAMFFNKEHRSKELITRASLLASICAAYLSGAILAGIFYINLGFILFFLVCISLVMIIGYDLYELSMKRYRVIKRRSQMKRKSQSGTVESSVKLFDQKRRVVLEME
jgi:uncharacterized membrane protein YoaK (UPF0700 family)